MVASAKRVLVPILPSAQQTQGTPQAKPQAKPPTRRPFDPAPKPKTAAKPPPKPKPQPRPRVAFGSKPQVAPPKQPEPKTIFGPKIKPARVTFAKKLAKVRNQYIGGAERRNKAAIKAGIKARAQQGGPTDMVGTPTSPPPTEEVLQAIIALNEALLVPTTAATAQDAQYQTHWERARLSESLEWKGTHHQRAGERAAALGSLDLAERHQDLATAFRFLAAD